MKSIIIPLFLLSNLALASKEAPLTLASDANINASESANAQVGSNKVGDTALKEGQPPEDYAYEEADKEIEQAFDIISSGSQNDFKAAYDVFYKYSQQGSSVAQYGLANMLKRGWGVDADMEESLFWLIQSSATGFPKSQYQLALAYRTGQGAEQDYKKAKEWYEAAAIFGHNQAMVDLAGMYLHGMGMPIDKEIALIWLKKAAGDNFAPALAILNQLGE
jgi:TPR repeat protein